jgi:hypothetical protein
MAYSMIFRRELRRAPQLNLTLHDTLEDCLSRNREQSNEFDRARDELFSHIHRCGVLKATVEQQEEWLEDTVEYMSERFPELGSEELVELRTIGLRFCRPVIERTQDEAASDSEGAGESVDAEAAAA